MLTDVLAAQTAEINGKFKVVEQRMIRFEEGQIRIEAQTTKTNGRVTNHDALLQKMQLIEKDHFVKCPNTDKIEMLEEYKTKTDTLKNFIIWAGGTTMAAILLVLAILEFLNK